MPITIGLDLAKRISWYAAIDENDNIIEDSKIPSTRTSLEAIVNKHNPELVLVEASSITAWAVDALVDLGAPVWPVHPASLPSRRQRRKKTDKVDAIQLVRLYRGGVLTKAWIPNKQLRALRNLARARFRLAVDRTMFRNRIHAALNQEGIRVRLNDIELESKGLFTKQGQRLAIQEHLELDGLYEVQNLLTKHMRGLEKRIESASKDIPEIQRIRGIPGIGPLVGLALYAEIGDIERFSNANQLVAYLGLDPMIEQSGDTVKHLGISHKGPAWLRGILTQAAWAHVTHAKDSYITKKYEALAPRIGAKKAIIATARRLVKTAYWVWSQDTEFDSSGRTPERACRQTATAV